MIHGILNVRKEKGFTSHDVVAKLRGMTRQKKIGHTGTLDPDAEGVLPVCLGKATRLCEMMTDKEKAYEAVLVLGKETYTQDLGGQILNETETNHLTKAEVEEAILSFLGSYDQIPPMYSALKVGGKKLYELAREGREVERKARRVEIRSLRVLDTHLPEVRFEVVCSKGTYVRTLCYDIGRKLGCGGCMGDLLRTKSGAFTLAMSHTLSEIGEYLESGRIGEILIPIDAMFPDIRRVTIKAGQEKSVYNGNPLRKGQLEDGENLCPEDGEQIRVYGSDGTFLALYIYRRSRESYAVEKMFYSLE